MTELELDLIARKVIYAEKDVIQFSAIPFAILLLLSQNPKKTISKQTIIDHTGIQADGQSQPLSAVSTQIKRVRDHLPGDFIKTNHGKGYYYDRPFPAKLSYFKRDIAKVALSGKVYYTSESDTCVRVEYYNGVYIGDIAINNINDWMFYPKCDGGSWSPYLMIEIGQKIIAMNEKELMKKHGT